MRNGRPSTHCEFPACAGMTQLVALAGGRHMDGAISDQRGKAMSETDKDEKTRADGRRTTLRNAGLAFGIGSAAITAALLYASKGKGKPPGSK